LPASSSGRGTSASQRIGMRSCSRIADKSVNVRIYRLGAMPLDIRGALSLRTAASMNYSHISCSVMFRRISAKPTSRALCSPPGQPFVKRSARCQSAFCICSALIRRVRQRPLKMPCSKIRYIRCLNSRGAPSPRVAPTRGYIMESWMVGRRNRLPRCALASTCRERHFEGNVAPDGKRESVSTRRRGIHTLARLRLRSERTNRLRRRFAGPESLKPTFGC
jgi:hypothetical protein